MDWFAERLADAAAAQGASDARNGAHEPQSQNPDYLMGYRDAVLQNGATE